MYTHGDEKAVDDKHSDDGGSLQRSKTRGCVRGKHEAMRRDSVSKRLICSNLSCVLGGAFARLGGCPVEGYVLVVGMSIELVWIPCLA